MKEDELYRALGFKDAREAHHLIASFSLADPKVMSAFVKWKEEDGTKDGLLKVRALSENSET
jgi:hypothetical protein